jgi:hypothetical protein
VIAGIRRRWRERWRTTWRDVRPFVFLATGLAVLVLGTIGYLERSPQYGLLDALYRAPGLFGSGGGVEPPVPWALEVARWLGPLLFGIAAIKVLLALFRQEARQLGIRLFVRDHVVVAGLGDKGFRLARGLHEDGQRVIVIDRSPDNPRIPGVRERGITVLDGDATDPEVLRRAEAGRAAHLVAVCGQDGVNIDVAVAGQQLAKGRRRGVLAAFAHVQDRRLWSTLSSAGIGSDQPTFRLDYFNVWALGAKALLDWRPPFEGAPTSHVLIVGLDGVGEHLALRVAGLWRAARGGSDARVRITLAGPGAAEHAAELERAHPELDDLCELAAQPGFGSPAHAPTRSYVCLADETEALAVALELRANGTAPVVVTVADADSGVARALDAEGRVLGGIEPFGVLSRALTPDLLRNADTELLARAKHEEYRRGERRRRSQVPDGVPANRSDVPWDELAPALKESNRRFADGISAKLTAAGCILVPDPLADHADPGFAFTDDEVEDLAIQEHERWMRDLERDGWKPTTGPKDEDRLLHPLLVPWSRLSEDEKDHDRDPVREIPAIIARAGFRVVRQADAPAPRTAQDHEAGRAEALR